MFIVTNTPIYIESVKKNVSILNKCLYKFCINNMPCNVLRHFSVGIYYSKLKLNDWRLLSFRWNVIIIQIIIHRSRQ